MRLSYAALTVTLLLTAGATGGQNGSSQDPPDPPMIDGEALFLKRCAGCHGPEGKGDGPVAAYLDPKPRNFSTGYFKLGSTYPGDMPSDADLARVITRRIFWSSMHPYGTFSEEEIAALAAHVKELSRYYDEDEQAWVNHFEKHAPARPLEVPPPPPKTPGLLHLGKSLFQINCAPCHGSGGRGDGLAAPTLQDAWGAPVRPRDFTIPIYKGGSDARDVFIRMSRGIPGTPMPSFYDALTPHERWAIAYFVVSLQHWPEDLVAQGRLMFRAYGCFACHGEEGGGGVRNPNYAKEEVPALSSMARRFLLFRPNDVEAFIDLLRRGIDPTELEEAPNIRRWPAVVAQYDSVRSVIKEGRKAGKLEEGMSDPPLNMPIWGHVLQEEDIEAIIAYLLTLRPEG